jgi:hypothetical protein
VDWTFSGRMTIRVAGETERENTMMLDALRDGRKIDVLLRRNTSNDHATEGARYTGFDICWEDGLPAQVNLARLCGIGVRQVFGDQVPQVGSFRVQYYLIPIDDRSAPRLAVPRSLKPRRVYFERQGPMAALHLANGFCTDIVFHQDDDPRILHWVGLPQLSHGQQQWVDIVAINSGEVGCDIGQQNESLSARFASCGAKP